MPGLTGSRWRDVVTIHRLEFPFPVNYVCYSVWGAGFAAGSVSAFGEIPVLAAVAMNLLLIVAALALNTAVDIRTDELQPDRGHLARAALRLGRTRALRWAATETACALVLAILISLHTGRWLVTVFAATVVALHLLYNLEPAHLKRRGFLGPMAFCAGLLVLPMLMSYSAVRGEVAASFWPVVVGMGTLATGRTIWWSIPDRGADAATGMTTPVVRYGARRSLVLACLIMLGGLGLFGWGLWWNFGPWWALLGLAAHLVFVGEAVALLRVPSDTLPTSRRLRTRSMPLATTGDVLLVLIPLVAG